MVSAPVTGNEVWTVDKLKICPSGCLSYVMYWSTEDVNAPGGVATVPEAQVTGGVAHCTAILQKAPEYMFGWKLMHVQKSHVAPLSMAPPPFYS